MLQMVEFHFFSYICKMFCIIAPTKHLYAEKQMQIRRHLLKLI